MHLVPTQEEVVALLEQPLAELLLDRRRFGAGICPRPRGAEQLVGPRLQGPAGSGEVGLGRIGLDVFQRHGADEQEAQVPQIGRGGGPRP